MAGGSGERLWPLSRQNKPKQLLAIENESLLGSTIERISSLVRQENIWVVTTEQQLEEIASLVQDMAGLVTVEPLSRNTGPAILLSCLALQAQDADALVMVLPSDHYMAKTKDFGEFLLHALDSAEKQQRIVSIGVKPSYPVQGYGYIEYDTKKTEFPYKVKKFIEKPTEKRLEALMKKPNVLWNTGMFCAPVRVIIEEFEKYAPDVFNAVKAHWIDGAPYEDVPAIAIDYAIMEKSKRTSVLPANFIWCDVGNLATFMSLRSQQHEVDVIEVDSDNNLIDVQKNLVALIGVEDMCIVQTEDILLIAKRSETDKVKLVLETLRHNSFDEYL
jgi:mannose-1-phosphate guanylyltransferase/mannose-6-phosphate isomerase